MLADDVREKNEMSTLAKKYEERAAKSMKDAQIIRNLLMSEPPE
ncbi:MAG: hypothetical protein AB1847_08940 [bacterium]